MSDNNTFANTDLSSLLETPEQSQGPLMLSISVIHEDPHQPRQAENPGFSKDSIAEIGATIKARGVKSPISVREDPENPGEYIINHGARRFRGAKWAKLDNIPAFVDNDYNEADQVIENIQRNELTPREMADYIGRELANGKKKGQIAKEIGKSPAFVTQHSILLDLPDPIADAFNERRVNDVTLISELCRLYKKDPEEITEWLANPEQEITRGSVKLLRDYLDEKKSRDEDLEPDEFESFDDYAQNELDQGNTGFDGENAPGDDGIAIRDLSDEGDSEDESTATKKKPADAPDKFKKAIVKVVFNGMPGQLVLTKRPSAPGYGWVKFDADGHEVEANLPDVKLDSLVEG